MAQSGTNTPRKRVKITPAQKAQDGDGALDKHWRTYFRRSSRPPPGDAIGAESREDNTHANYREANRALWRLTPPPLVGKILTDLCEELEHGFRQRRRRHTSGCRRWPRTGRGCGRRFRPASSSRPRRSARC